MSFVLSYHLSLNDAQSCPMNIIEINDVDRKILNIAYPIILANITIPLLGITDTAVLGQLGDLNILAGISLGAVIIGAIYWFFGFLRMGITGLVSQARGSDDSPEVVSLLIRGLFIAFGGGVFLIFVQSLIFDATFFILSAEETPENLSRSYMSIRMISAPAAISCLVFTGWLFGLGKTLQALYLLLIINISNIFLDILFVKVFYLGIKGVAFATVISEILGFLFGLFLCKEYLFNINLIDKRRIFSKSKWLQLLFLNLNIVIRSTLLQAAFLSYLFFGTLFGSLTLSANHILFQMSHFSAYALDGIAFSSEILVGESIGKRQHNYYRRIIRSCFKLGFIFSIILSIFFFIFGFSIINIMTSLDEVRQISYNYLFWIIVTPILAFSSFLLDGIFLGAARGTEIRNAMLQSFTVFSISALILVELFGNQGLWASIAIFYIARGITLKRYLHKINALF